MGAARFFPKGGKPHFQGKGISSAKLHVLKIQEASAPLAFANDAYASKPPLVHSHDSIKNVLEDLSHHMSVRRGTQSHTASILDGTPVRSFTLSIYKPTSTYTFLAT